MDRVVFQTVCPTCNSVAVQIDAPEVAPDRTVVRCGNCRAPRGTMGAMSAIAYGHQGDLPESDHSQAGAELQAQLRR